MIIYPNAKINIGLNIASKRLDGYHNIKSVFYPLKDSFDILEIIELNAGRNLTKATAIKDKVVKVDNKSLLALKIKNEEITIKMIANVSSKSLGIFCKTKK